MISLKRFSPLLLAIPMLALTACQEQTNIDQDGVAVDTTTQQLEGFRSDVRAELQEIDQELNRLEQEMAQVGDTAAMEMETSIAELRRERDEIDRDLQQLGQDANQNWTNMRGDLNSRVNDLAVDVSRARMMAAETVEEFQNVAQEELNEIDNKIADFRTTGAMGDRGTGTMDDDRTGMTDGQRDMADGQTGRTDDRIGEGADIAQDQPLPDADGRIDGRTTTDGTTAWGSDANLQEWQEEREQLAQDVQELDATTDDSFDERKEELAEAIADLNAEVRDALSRMHEESDFVQAGY